MTKELTKEAVGQRIRDALTATGRPPEWLAAEARISLSSLNRYMKGTHDASAIEVWRIAKATGQSFGWFAGEADPAAERLATTAERAEHEVHAMHARLDQLIADLTEARLAFVGDNPQLDRLVGKQAAKKPRKAVTVASEAAG